jgi:15-cis-phytoene synthase
MMCHVMGVRDLAAMRRAAHLGMAMQLTNICRDVLEDWAMARLYLPEDMLAECGAPELAAKLGGAFPDEAAEPAGRVVARLLREGRGVLPIWRRGDADALLALRACGPSAARRIYAAIGRRIERQGCSVHAGRAIVPLRAKLGHVLACARNTVMDAPRRVVRQLLPVNRESASGRFVVRFPDDVLPLSETDR